METTSPPDRRTVSLLTGCKPVVASGGLEYWGGGVGWCCCGEAVLEGSCGDDGVDDTGYWQRYFFSSYLVGRFYSNGIIRGINNALDHGGGLVV